ncbi:SWIM-type domain-containing protein [Raphanus sativus]|nr:SWIM-type domain-containing protein [Raphanus sativus]
MAILEKARVAKKFCSTIRSRTTLYEVNEFNVGYTVDLAAHQCACRRWNLTGIPCKHAICVLDDNQDDAEKYVPDYYSTLCLKNTYADNIRPVNGEKLWNKMDNPPIGIPDIRKPRGRPKNATEEKNLLNHYKIQIHPKRQPKPRKNKNNPLVGSSSQLLKTPQSSSAIPAASTAPQQSVTSTQPAKHVKKASRGRPLKIRKIENIPSGSGTFWSPFTDRPFEVFGNRIYDRSATDSQPPQ